MYIINPFTATSQTRIVAKRVIFGSFPGTYTHGLQSGALFIMNTRLRHNILGLGTPGQFIAISAGLEAGGVLDARVREKIPPDVQYACVYWENHLETANTKLVVFEVGG